MKNYNELKGKIAKILNSKELYLTEKDGAFQATIYTSYDDVISQETVAKIMESNAPHDALCEWVYNSYEDHVDYEMDEIISKVKENLPDEDEEKIRDILLDLVFFEYPFDHFLNSSVRATVIMDVGESNFDFTTNACEEGMVEEGCSIAWLGKYFGYELSTMEEALEGETLPIDTFLGSFQQEIAELHSSMPAITFLVTMSLKEMIEFAENKKANPEKEYVINKEACCGLHDFWYGAGSMLELVLEKDVILPAKFIRSCLPDGMDGYGIDEVYGLVSSVWEPSKIQEVMQVSI